MKKVKVNTCKKSKMRKWTLEENEKNESEHLKRMKKVKVNAWREWKRWKWTLEENEKSQDWPSTVSERLHRRDPRLEEGKPESHLRKIFEIFHLQENWTLSCNQVHWERFLRFFIYKKIEHCLAIKSTEKDFWDFSFPRKLNIDLQSSPLACSSWTSGGSARL